MRTVVVASILAIVLAVVLGATAGLAHAPFHTAAYAPDGTPPTGVPSPARLAPRVGVAVWSQVNNLQLPEYGIEFTKTPSTWIFDHVGQVINYTLTATNTGATDWDEVYVADAKLGSLTCTHPQGATLYSLAVVTCTGSYTVTQADYDAGYVSNEARTTYWDWTWQWGVGWGSYILASATVFNVMELSLTKTPSTTTYDHAGQVVDYSLVATNTGNVTLNGVTIGDTKLSTLTCVPPQPATVAAGAALRCTGGYVVSQGDVDAGSLTNTATVTGTGPLDRVVSDTVSATVTALQVPQISLLKQIGEKPSGPWSSSIRVDAGTDIYYKFTIQNRGNVTLSPIGIDDADVSTAGCAWPASLAPGESATCVSGPLTSKSGTHRNTASAHGAFGGQTYTSPPSSAMYIAGPLAGGVGGMLEPVDKAEVLARALWPNPGRVMFVFGLGLALGVVLVRRRR